MTVEEFRELALRRVFTILHLDRPMGVPLR